MIVWHRGRQLSYPSRRLPYEARVVIETVYRLGLRPEVVVASTGSVYVYAYLPDGRQVGREVRVSDHLRYGANYAHHVRLLGYNRARRRARAQRAVLAALLGCTSYGQLAERIGATGTLRLRADQEAVERAVQERERLRRGYRYAIERWQTPAPELTQRVYLT